MNPNHSVRARQRLVRHHADRGDALAFFNVLTSPELMEQVESMLPPHRERLFPPTETLSMFLSQALSSDRSCQRAVDEAAVRRLNAGMPPCSSHTGAYCNARQRLPSDMVCSLTRYTGQSITTCVPAAWRWRGRPVRLVDGTTVTLPDTPANQAAFPQSRSQKPGLGFPICRVLGLLCLDSGAVLNAAVGPFRGKGGDEQSLLRTVLDTLQRGDVLIGDAYFATYFLLTTLFARGIDAVFEQHGARRRSTDFRCGKRIGTRDHLIVLQKPVLKPGWMSASDYEEAPTSITVREVHVGGKILVTTLLCAKETSKAELHELYRNRWQVELDLRNIKATLGMATLTCHTPAMCLKELWVYLLAYNLIRLMMAQAAVTAGCKPRTLSFKHTVQVWMAWTQQGQCLDLTVAAQLFVVIAQLRVGNRPGRVEPRAVKRRNKPYPMLTVPRDEARQRIIRHGHPAPR
jgi:hypothetical protein